MYYISEQNLHSLCSTGTSVKTQRVAKSSRLLDITTSDYIGYEWF